MATSSSQFPTQLERFRLVEPTRTIRLSATAVFAWIIAPFHSKMRTPLWSSRRYSVRDALPTHRTSLLFGSSSRTSTPCEAAALSASMNVVVPMK